MRTFSSRISLDAAKDACTTGVAYFLCASLTLHFTRFDNGIAIVWLAGALLFAKLCATPHRRWPLLILACLPAALASGFLFGIAGIATLSLPCVALAEACVAAWMVKRAFPRFGRFQSVPEASAFLLIAGIMVPAAGASLSAWLAHLSADVAYWAAWRNWYAGHALGLIAFSPPMLLAFRGEIGRWARSAGHRYLEAAALLGAVVLTAAATFGQNELPIVVVPVVAMIAATVRLGRFGAVASIVILMTIGMGCSLAGLGPTTLLRGSMIMKMQVLQIYFATIVFILLPLSAELKARRRLMTRLEEAQTFHKLILDRTSDLILRLSNEGAIRYASSSACRLWGYASEDLVGRSAFDFMHVDDRPILKAIRQKVLSRPEEVFVAEYRIHRQDGSEVWMESHIRAAVGDDGRPEGTVSIIREVTRRRQIVADLARRAETDPLTGLYNRRAFDDRLLASFQGDPDGQSRGYIALFDLDHFKQINDRHGHAAGDATLIRFAEMLRTLVREGDLVARLGGEEFGVLLLGATLEQARVVCDRIRRHLADTELHCADGSPLRVTVSVGIAPLARQAHPRAALEAADRALYQAKAAGRNQLALAA